MKFGVYIHIPYCIQRCSYCDFTTFKVGTTLPPEDYLKLLDEEVKQLSPHVPYRQIDTIYFGGGTPSLLEAKQLKEIIESFRSFALSPKAEITLEINPATIDDEKLQELLSCGFNRFSVGTQTFDKPLLEACGREHSVEDSYRTLELLKKHDVNYSFDLLFALPKQTLKQLEKDLKIIQTFSPPHLSAYCLTVPQNHPMSFHRPHEKIQVEMFDLIESELNSIDLVKYEISNFARPGYESQHNLLYWTNQPYWGIGLSSHSYFSSLGHGFRFWNSPHWKQYTSWVQQLKEQKTRDFYKLIPAKNQEQLTRQEFMTDYCHTHLRLQSGISEEELHRLFSSKEKALILKQLQQLCEEDLLESSKKRFRLTPQGHLLCNLVFSRLLFT